MNIFAMSLIWDVLGSGYVQSKQKGNQKDDKYCIAERGKYNEKGAWVQILFL